MENVVKFRWEGPVEHETGLAIYEIGTSTYSLWLPGLRSAQLVHMALSNIYKEGYEDGVRKTRLAVHSALSKLLEDTLS
jgi:hypothetical protein